MNKNTEITREQLVRIARAAMGARLQSEELQRALKDAGLLDAGGWPTSKVGLLDAEVGF